MANAIAGLRKRMETAIRGKNKPTQFQKAMAKSKKASGLETISESKHEKATKPAKPVVEPVSWETCLTEKS
ncbi:MAG: hypothetical protein HRT90_02815 [Candidatus Margulisbacteria bacterium]|nr:hypothetical protein [Candidatus Margulisiibacteriota bacterium]